MVRTFFAALIIATLSLPAPGQTQQSATPSGSDATQPGPSQFEVAQGLAAKGRLEKAMALLDKLAAQTPEPAGVERLRGIIFYQREDFPQAIAAFTKASEQDPNDRESIEMHGVSLFRTGRSPEALPFLEQAHATVVRANVDPEYVLGLCYTDVKRYDDARHAFATQYGFAPDSAEAYLLAARLFLRRDLAAEAAAQAHKALEINPTLPLAHQLLGEVSLAKAEFPGAIQQLEEERKINPLNPLLYDRLGDAYLRNGQYENAQQALNRAVLLEPNATAPYILLGQTFLKLNQPIQALHYLDHAAKMDPASYLIHNLLGQAYKATGQVVEANREFQMVVDLQNNTRPPAGK
ncbi:MAG: tetratricopeptide repeat protein [Terracidiphilus sp.]